MMVPDRRLLLLCAVPGALAFGGLFWPVLSLPAWTALLVVVVVSTLDLWHTRALPLPELQCVAPERGRVGTGAEFRYRIRNPADVPRRVSLLVELPLDLGGDLPIEAVDLDPAQTVELTRERVPERRGMRPLGPALLLCRSRLGLFWRRLSTAPLPAFGVLPDPGVPDSALALQDRLLHARLGIRPQRPRGEGLEFESLREYVPGDEPRHLDWRASARARRLIVRQHQVERNHNVVVAVDSGRLMSSRIEGATKLDHALEASIALVHATRRTGDRIGLLAFDREVRAWVPPIDPTRSIAPLLDATLPLEPSSDESSYRALADLIMSHQKKRALLIVLTDFVEGTSSAGLEGYLTLLARRHCALLVALRDPLLGALDRANPGIEGDEIYRRLVLQDILVERETALARIRRLGVQTLDLDPAQVTAPLLNRYLEIRAAGLL
jgi:uncharacterized protein (DUF58 family)